MGNKLTRRRHVLKKRVAPGAPPGTLIADPQATKPVIKMMAWGTDAFEEVELEDPKNATSFLQRHRVTWIDVDGLGDARVIEELGSVLGLHPLALEDVLSQTQRPKVEEYPNNLFIVVRMASLSEDHLVTEQLSIFLGDGFVATFQGTRPGDCLNPVRERIRRGLRIRELGPDYLAYALVDATVDFYFPIADSIGEIAESLQDELISSVNADMPRRIQQLKHDLMTLRRVVTPLRDVCSALSRDPESRISSDTRIFFRDCHDHTVQLLDVIGSYREIGGSLTELYVAGVNNRMNEVMKFLTLVATIFIPLTFIAGIYGMNFDTRASPWSMPELETPFGYPAVLAVMFIIAGGLTWFFKRKGWLGPTR